MNPHEQLKLCRKLLDPHYAGRSRASFKQRTLRLSKRNPYVVKFSRPGCGWCDAMEPAWKKAKATDRSGTKWVTVNVMRNSDIAEEMKILTVPTIIGFHGGRMTKYESEDRTTRALLAFARGLHG